jgi:hypothetical protein
MPPPPLQVQGQNVGVCQCGCRVVGADRHLCCASTGTREHLRERRHRFAGFHLLKLRDGVCLSARGVCVCVCELAPVVLIVRVSARLCACVRIGVCLGVCARCVCACVCACVRTCVCVCVCVCMGLEDSMCARVGVPLRAAVGRLSFSLPVRVACSCDDSTHFRVCLGPAHNLRRRLLCATPFTHPFAYLTPPAGLPGGLCAPGGLLAPGTPQPLAGRRNCHRHVRHHSRRNVAGARPRVDVHCRARVCASSSTKWYPYTCTYHGRTRVLVASTRVRIRVGVWRAGDQPTTCSST